MRSLVRAELGPRVEAEIAVARGSGGSSGSGSSSGSSSSSSIAGGAALQPPPRRHRREAERGDPKLAPKALRVAAKRGQRRPLCGVPRKGRARMASERRGAARRAHLGAEHDDATLALCEGEGEAVHSPSTLLSSFFLAPDSKGGECRVDLLCRGGLARGSCCSSLATASRKVFQIRGEMGEEETPGASPCLPVHTLPLLAAAGAATHPSPSAARAPVRAARGSSK